MAFGSITREPEQGVNGQWVQDDLVRLNVLPGGVPLQEDQFTGVPLTADNKLFLASGTLIGRTFAERDAGIGYGIADVVNDDQIYLILYDIPDVNDCPVADVYRHNRLVAENHLPENLANGTALAGSPELDWIRENYECFYMTKSVG